MTYNVSKERVEAWIIRVGPRTYTQLREDLGCEQGPLQYAAREALGIKGKLIRCRQRLRVRCGPRGSNGLRVVWVLKRCPVRTRSDGKSIIWVPRKVRPGGVVKVSGAFYASKQLEDARLKVKVKVDEAAAEEGRKVILAKAGLYEQIIRLRLVEGTTL